MSHTPQKTERLNKTEVLTAALQGFPFVHMTAPSKKQYQGEFYCYWNERFIHLGAERTEDVDVNNLASEYWELFTIHARAIPQTLYRAHIEKAKVIELRKKQEFSHDWGWHPQYKLFLPTVIWEFEDIETGRPQSVKFKLEANTLRKSVKGLDLVIDTDKVEHTKSHTHCWFRNYVEEQLKIQKKRSSRKPPIKTMKVVEKIYRNLPQAFI